MKKILELLAVVVVTASLYVGCLSVDPYTVVLPDLVAVDAGDTTAVELPDEPPPVERPPLVPIPPLVVIVPDDPPPVEPPDDPKPPVVVPVDVVPNEVREKIGNKMTFYTGTTPPDISGQYVADNFTLVSSSLSYDDIGSTGWYDQYIAFIRGSNGKILYKAREGTDSEYSSEDVVIDVVGSNNNFTAYFVLTGTSRGIKVKQSTVISGTWTSDGIRGFQYAFIMLEKGPDPSGVLVPVNTYRVFKDGDGLASKYSWLSKKAQSPVLERQGLLEQSVNSQREPKK